MRRLGRGKEEGQRVGQACVACKMLAISPNLRVPDPHAISCRPSPASRRFSAKSSGGARAQRQRRQRTCTGLAPAATIFMPSAIMAADRMVAVVVPSPARSLVRAAACSSGGHRGAAGNCNEQQEWKCGGATHCVQPAAGRLPQRPCVTHLQSMYGMLCSHEHACACACYRIHPLP